MVRQIASLAHAFKLSLLPKHASGLGHLQPKQQQAFTILRCHSQLRWVYSNLPVADTVHAAERCEYIDRMGAEANIAGKDAEVSTCSTQIELASFLSTCMMPIATSLTVLCTAATVRCELQGDSIDQWLVHLCSTAKNNSLLNLRRVCC